MYRAVRARLVDALLHEFLLGVTKVAHDSAMQRIAQAGAVPVSVLALACELQRDWGRPQADRLRAIMREYFGKPRVLKK